MTGPLAGVRVLDLSRILAGPWSTQILTDLGADVLKIERPGQGDDTRTWGPPWLKDKSGEDTADAAYYFATNRGKHSVAIDIASDEGRELVQELAKDSDVLVENFKVGALARKGLAYDDLRRINPGLVYCSITGFGQTGPRAREAGYDYLIQAMGGLMSITGNADGSPGAGPQRAGVAVADLMTGMYATIGILAALRHRDLTGEGQHIDLALLDSQVAMLGNQAMNYLIGGKTPQRTGGHHPNITPYQQFETKDGHVIIAVGNDDQFRKLVTRLGRSELGNDPRFDTNAHRITNRAEIGKIIESVTRTRTSADWIAELAKAGVPCGPINNIAQVFDEPQVQHRGGRVMLRHPANGDIPSVGNPLKFSATPVQYKKAPPSLGQDTASVLKDRLAKSDDEIAELRSRGVIGTGG